VLPRGNPYVRIGVLMPMTSAEGSSMKSHEIMYALRGAYTAQKQANEVGTPTLATRTR